MAKFQIWNHRAWSGFVPEKAHSLRRTTIGFFARGILMARKATKKRKYSKSSGSDVKSEMRRYKKGSAKSGRGGKGGKVKSRKQAIAIGLSKARKKGKKVPKKKS
jgi:hypothetical protein